MKKILIILFAILINTNLQSAGDGGGSSNESMYDEGVKLVKRAGKLEKKDNIKKIRPGNGVHPRYYNSLINKKSPKKLFKGDPLTKNILSLLKIDIKK